METERTALIAEGILPLYSKPAPHQVIIDEALYGMSCIILETQDDYARIRMEYGYEGWVHRKGLKEGSWPGYLKKLRVIKRQIDVLAKPEVDSELLCTMPMASVLARAEDAYNRSLKPGWVCVRLVDGRIGYTKTSYFVPYVQPRWDGTDLPEETFRKGVTEMVRRYEGTHYRWGGKSPQGIDCSGLCSIAYLLMGVIIYRDASLKPGYCLKEITLDKMREGDLLFFKGHVAMYLGGPDKLYIHSTAKAGSDGVDYNSLRVGSPLYREDLAKGILGIGSIF